MDKLTKTIAKWCIKLLTIDKVRTWFVVNVLREVDVDDIIAILKNQKPEVIECPKCGHRFEKK